ncbi:hypothetical protein FS837_002164, partial [Tulasnella sp. UAMH 9824]
MEIITAGRERIGNLRLQVGEPTVLSRVASYGFKLVHWWQFVVWFLEQSCAKLRGLARRWADRLGTTNGETGGSAGSGSGNSHATQTSCIPETPGTPSVPLSDPAKDDPCYNETTAPPDLPEPKEPTTAPLHPQTDPAQTVLPDPLSPTPRSSAIHEPNFEPATSSFRGCVQQPEGKPSGGGSYSDVFRCPIQFVTPSKEHPSE